MTNISLRINITANYASQLYVTGIGILILPLYIRYMGAEAYGLIGFFTLLQSWFALLDLGLTPTIGRETARFHGGSMTALTYRRLFRALSLIFITIALLGGTSIFMLAEQVATRWLRAEDIETETVTLAVQIMAMCVSMRWLGGLYRGVISGSERLVWLSSFNALIATLRFIAVFVTMQYYGFTPTVFFWHQLVIALIELGGLWLMSLRLLPTNKKCMESIGWSVKPVLPVLKFALSIAFISSVWILVTQTDKLILSSILPLDAYGYFILAVLIASGIMLISGPISSAIMPRMARLNAEGKHIEMIQVYRKATQLVSIIASSVALAMAFYSEPLVFAWTGSAELAEKVAPVLRLYAIGNAFLAVGAFPYYLQYALGNMKYHILGNIIMILALVPSIIWSATNYGSLGAGYAWLSMNAIYFCFWVAYVHYKLEPGLHVKWLIEDCLVIYGPNLLILVFMMQWPITSGNRLIIIFKFLSIFTILLVVASMMSSAVRELVVRNCKLKDLLWVSLKK